MTRAVVATALGVALAAAGLWSLLALGAAPGAQALSARTAGAQPIIDIAHLPPLLSTADDHLSVLRYDIACTEPATESDSSCDIDGTAYVRVGASGIFQALPLLVDAAASVGRYTAILPTHVAASATGFTYYAVVRDGKSGATTTLPAGGATAPQRSLRLANPINVDLGTHQFGDAHPASARVATAHWGDGPTDVGIEEGPQAEPIGASSFDVESAGNVTVLDDAHKRLLRFASGAPSTPTAIAVGVRGTIADLAVRSDGGTYVLESVAEPGQTPLLRSFDSTGQQVGLWHTAEALANKLRLGPTGLQALEYPASQWMPLATGGGQVSAATQLAQGRAGRAVAGGRELVAQREGNEARVALVDSTGVVKSWRIRSATPLAEIQLAEPLGTRVVVVLRAYTDANAAFDVLVLGNLGLVQHFAVVAADWAETAPLSRFRLVGSSLYHLGSTPTDMFVDRFDLEVH
ncbi:MAG: hypothetical protein ABI927_07860 [Gaiellaceae bacterium]